MIRLGDWKQDAPLERPGIPVAENLKIVGTGIGVGLVMLFFIIRGMDWLRPKIFPWDGSVITLAYSERTAWVLLIPITMLLVGAIAALVGGLFMPRVAFFATAEAIARERRLVGFWNTHAEDRIAELEDGEEPLALVETDRTAAHPDQVLAIMVFALSFLMVFFTGLSLIGEALYSDPLAGPPAQLALFLAWWVVPWSWLLGTQRDRNAAIAILLTPPVGAIFLLVTFPQLRDFVVGYGILFVALAVHAFLMVHWFRRIERERYLLVTDRGVRLLAVDGTPLTNLRPTAIDRSPAFLGETWSVSGAGGEVLEVRPVGTDAEELATLSGGHGVPIIVRGPSARTRLSRELLGLLPRMLYLVSGLFFFGAYFTVTSLTAAYDQSMVFMSPRVLIDLEEINTRVADWYRSVYPKRGRPLYLGAAVQVARERFEEAGSRISTLRKREQRGIFVHLPDEVDFNSLGYEEVRKEVDRFLREAPADGWEPRGNPEALQAFRRGMAYATSRFIPDQDGLFSAAFEFRRARSLDPAAPGPRLALAWLLVNHLEAIAIQTPWILDDAESREGERGFLLKTYLEIGELLEPLAGDEKWRDVVEVLRSALPAELGRKLREPSRAELAEIDARLPGARKNLDERRFHEQSDREEIRGLLEKPPGDGKELRAAWAGLGNLVQVRKKRRR